MIKIKCCHCSQIFKSTYEPFICPSCKTVLEIKNYKELEIGEHTSSGSNPYYAALMIAIGVFIITNALVDMLFPERVIGVLGTEVSVRLLTLLITGSAMLLIGAVYFIHEREKEPSNGYETVKKSDQG